MRALSIRQPFAELILRGIKTVEYRSRPTRIIGQRFHIYACKGTGAGDKVLEKGRIWSRDLAMAGEREMPAWMIELAEQIKLIPPGTVLPRGVIVGSAVIEKVSRVDDGGAMYRWHLAQVERARKLRKPAGHPQPVWFEPFD